MLNLGMLDVLIGLATIYLTLAVACTAIVEAISSWLKLRSRNLENGMKELLKGDFADGEQVVDAFYKHPLIASLSHGDGGRPSYIPSELVGKVVTAVVIAKAGGVGLEDAVNELPPRSNHVKALLQYFVAESKLDAKAFEQVVAAHFDTTMERASGWFKRRTRWVTLGVSLILVVAVNVDTIAITTALAADPSARTALANLSQDRVQLALSAQKQAANQEGDVVKQAEADTKAAREALTLATQALETTGLPLGWSEGIPASPSAYFSKAVGLLVSVFAISLGAPFWFGLLQRFDAVRSGGNPETPKDKGQSPPTLPAEPPRPKIASRQSAGSPPAETPQAN